MTRAREEQIIEAAYKEAKARGLPDGWTCTIDVSCVYGSCLEVVASALTALCCVDLMSPLSGTTVLLLETQTSEMDGSESW